MWFTAEREIEREGERERGVDEEQGHAAVHVNNVIATAKRYANIITTTVARPCVSSCEYKHAAPSARNCPERVLELCFCIFMNAAAVHAAQALIW